MQNAKKAKKEALKTLSIAGHTIELSELKNDVLVPREFLAPTSLMSGSRLRN